MSQTQAPQVVETDVLVIGGGGAAARAALAAQEHGARTTLVVKGWFGWTGFRGGGATGCGNDPRWGYSCGLGVPGHPEEEEELNVKLILQAGLGMADRNLVRSMVAEQGEARRDLEKWGAVVAGNFAESDRRRWVQVMPALACAARASDVQVRDHTMIIDLLVEDGQCKGGVGLDESGAPVVFTSKATILATGGDARLFALSCHPSCVTGDGYAMGYRAGADLINMEFMQAFLATVVPTVNVLPCTSYWPQRPRITNALGREFLSDYLPSGCSVEECFEERAWHNPFSTRDRCSHYLDFAVVKEVLAGRGGPRGGCYLQGLDPRKMWHEHREWLIFRGIDASQPMEISSVHQCSDGGLYVKENAESTVSCLYAVGEVSAGMHGADRLGGHMMVNSQVFGRRAGKDAATRAKEQSAPRVSQSTAEPALERIEALRVAQGDRKPGEVLKALQQANWEGMLVVRNEDGLNRTLQKIEEIKAESMPRLSVGSPADLTTALELQNLLLVGEMVGKAALMRRESRGGHFREDFPARDDANWLRVIRFRNRSGDMQMDTFVIDPEWEGLPGDMGKWVWG
ncbi:MAG: FAD-binding protein [Dehalococcoidales bacterium]|nr:FAD-binding protein [Dehalococcoidales bacterium]